MASADERKGAPTTGGGAPAPDSTSVNELLRRAVRRNNLAEVKALLRNGADPNYQRITRNNPASLYYEEPPWAMAAKLGYEDVLIALMEAGGNPNLQARYETNEGSSVRETALFTTVAWNMPNIAHILLRYGADPNLLGNSVHLSSTPLMMACARESEEMVVALLEAGADPNAVINGYTARDYWDYFDTILRKFEAKTMMRSRERLRLDPTKAGRDPRLGERPYDLADMPHQVMSNVQFMSGARPNPVPNSSGRGLPFVHIVL